MIVQTIIATQTSFVMVAELIDQGWVTHTDSPLLNGFLVSQCENMALYVPNQRTLDDTCRTLPSTTRLTSISNSNRN